MFFSKCHGCGELMEVCFQGQSSHPNCKPSEIFQLTSDWCNAAQREDVKECNRLQKRIDGHDKPAQLGPSALWYAQECHWPVFPLRPGTKLPATKNGFKDATTDPDQIREWWSQNELYNLATPTGRTFDVIDVDGPIGIQSIVDLEMPDIHGRVSTPRGIHYYVKSTGEGNRVGIRPGLDYRGAGGLIVLPPSRMEDKAWVWAMQPSPEIRGAPVLT